MLDCEERAEFDSPSPTEDCALTLIPVTIALGAAAAGWLLVYVVRYVGM
jgi:hypothetical protein